MKPSVLFIFWGLLFIQLHAGKIQALAAGNTRTKIEKEIFSSSRLIVADDVRNPFRKGTSASFGDNYLADYRLQNFTSPLSPALPSVCCPEFILKDALEICPPDGACAPRGTADPGGLSHSLAACKNSFHTYTVYPNDPAYSYTWTITGGTPASASGNPVTILWGNGTTGTIKVVISNIGSGGSCLDSITRQVCLIDGPQADFTMQDDTVCAGTPVQFTNTSIGGSVFFWNFGDGSTSNLATPPAHTYTTAGTYTITLTVQDMGSGQSGGSAGGQEKNACGCRDTIAKTIVVLPGSGPVIDYDCCFGTVCPGDTSSFCTPMVCGTYNWSVTGGTIVSGLNSSCIKVKWNAAYSGPTTVTLQSCPNSGCPGSTTLNVPVLYPNLPINGPTTVCIGSSGSYSLPWLPGTYYNWSVSGAGMYFFNQVDKNSTLVNITFNTAGPYWVKCEYNNPISGCNGVDSVLVNVLPIFSITGDDKVCENTAPNYSAPTPANWSVSPAGPTIFGNGNPTVSVLWAPPGNYTLMAISQIPGLYCNDTAYMKIRVIARPILGPVTGIANACANSKATFAITSNVSGSPFVWTVSPGNIPSHMGADNDSIVADLQGSGPWTITVLQNQEIKPGVFCPSLTQTYIVNPYPVPVPVGPATVCMDDIVNYTVTGTPPPGGYQWTIIPSAQGTIQSGQGTNSIWVQWHGPANPSAIIKMTNCSGFSTLPVVVNGPPTPVATYSQVPVFCQGAAVTLNLSTGTGAGYSYQWYLNGSPVPTGTNPVLPVNISTLPLGTHQYYVVVTLNGCSARSNIINVIIEDCGAGGSGSPPPGCTCDAIPFFRPYVVCGSISLLNQSSVTPPNTITAYQWSVSGPGTGTFTPSNSVATPSLSVDASGLYTISLTVWSSSGCSCTYSTIVNVFLPVASMTITSPVCQGSPAFFSAIPNNPAYNYNWSFGDSYTSNLANTQHAYSSASPPYYYVNLTIQNEYGCIATALDSVWVDPKPACAISAPDTAFCPGSFVPLTACGGMTSYQWYKNGNAISGATSQIHNANEYGEYQVEMINTFGCIGKSNKLFIYIRQQPKAKITGNRYICAYPGNTEYINLSTTAEPSYTYSWSSLPGGAVFTPSNTSSTSAMLTVPALLPAIYEFIVNVTDTVTGCTNSDTICVTFYEKPPLTVTNFDICEGNTMLLNPVPNNTTLYNYQWNNGASTPVITAVNPGSYILTITDKNNGCSATAFAGTVHALPDLSLFPLGCDSICDTDTLFMYIPLPLNWTPPLNTYPAAYPTIIWYDNGNYGIPVGYGQSFPFVTNVTGNHQLSVVVSNAYGCQDTAGVFCLNVRNCPPFYGIDFGDVPDDDILPGDFPTLLLSNGARHFISPGVYLGSQVDAETDGQPSFMAVCDDNDCFFVSSGDDEDGVTIPPSLIQGSTVNITVTASVSGYLDAWVDFNQNSDWSDAGDHVFINQALSAGANTLSLTIPLAANTGISYSRFRFRTANNVITFSGSEADGEVEDYALHIDPVSTGELDFGDVPDNPANTADYPTLLTSNGARHNVIAGIYLGTLIDLEGDGQPAPAADGDDVSSSDDEDGVLIPAVIVQGSTVNITVTASVNGYLDAWMDFNIDGDWADTGEQFLVNQSVVTGPNTLTLSVPLAAMTGPSYTRFRFHTASGAVNYDGLVADGEVEDYAVYIEPVPGEFDFGDVPDDDLVAADFPTLLLSNGARHQIVPGVFLGALVDPESDGQPSFGAVCDDNDCFYPSAGDDEDGIILPSTINAGTTVTVTVTASTTGFLDAWMDFNLDSDWSTAGEHIFVNQPLSAGANTLTFNVPSTALTGTAYSRFRFRTSSAPVSFFGLVADGEVEDYASSQKAISTQEDLDFGDVPDNPGNPADFPTLLASNGARHTVVAGVYMGLLIDTETNGQPNITATGDDAAGTDDEDGITIPSNITVGTTVNISVVASVSGFLDAWIDYNGNGTWGAGIEHIFTSQPLSAGANALSFTVPGATTPGQSYARFRFRTTAAPISFNGLVADGEVEDYAVHFDPQSEENIDYGDAPDNPQSSTDYPTLLSGNGASHLIIPTVYMGALIDSELDGQPNIASSGDDINGADDEDGVNIPAVVVLGSTVNITVSASVNGFLDAWIDYNIDGDWADLGEHIFTNTALTAGSNALSFTVPATATSGQSYSRFRFRTSSAAITYDGPLSDGEVEDYATYLEPAPQGLLDFGDVPDNWDIPNDYPTLLISNGARHTIVPNIYMGTKVDPETDGQPSPGANCDDNDCVFVSLGDDEDGINMPAFVLQGATVNLTVVASVSGYLDAWMDFNIDGDWADIGEHIFTNQSLSAGSNNISFVVPNSANMGPTYSRFRFRTANTVISYDGLVTDGEVEDYATYIEGNPQPELDFGDAPDNPLNPNDYPTLLSGNGARHTIANNTYLGFLIDGESDGQPNVPATGDNVNTFNDEDGVTFLWPMSPGNPCKIKVVASVNNAFLNMWVDFNGNGNWADAGEHVYTDINPVAGNNYFTFMVPASAIPGQTYARIRFSNQSALTYAGAASDGEVEDYRVNIQKYNHKWHQLPDEILPGLPSGQSGEVADDWTCNGGLVTQFDWWGNYEMSGGLENRGEGISHFIVTVHTDGSCMPETEEFSYSVPFTDQLEASTGSVNGENSPIYKYSFILPLPFHQIKDHKYWLSVKAIPNNSSAAPAWRWQEANRWVQSVECPTLSNDAATGWQPVFWPDPAFGQYSDMAFSVINSEAKQLNIKVLPEGLYNGSGGLNKAMDEYGEHFIGEIADHVTVELHSNAAPYQSVFTADNVNLMTDGTLNIHGIPEMLSGEYYIVVKHRNSIETWSALPIAFGGNNIDYDFSTSASQAYGNNLRQVGSSFVIYGGDATQDGIVDGSDMAVIDNSSTAIQQGYLPEDINGDGIVDGTDMAIVDNNSTNIIYVIRP